MYRIQRYDDNETGIHWQIGKGGGFHYHEAERWVRAPVTSRSAPPALIVGDRAAPRRRARAAAGFDGARENSRWCAIAVAVRARRACEFVLVGRCAPRNAPRGAVR